MQEKVREFQIASGQPVGVGVLVDERLRTALLKEEISELEVALLEEDRIEILDALCDIKYVNDGTANELSVKLSGAAIPLSGVDWLAKLKECDVTDVELVDECVHALAVGCGFSKSQLYEGLRRVHESNMSKFCTTVGEADRTIEYYTSLGVECNLVRIGNSFVVKSKEGKTLKSVDYKRVYLEDLV